VELRRAFRRRQSVLREEMRGVEIHRGVEALRRRVVVDDLEVLAAGPRVERLPRHAERDLADRGGL